MYDLHQLGWYSFQQLVLTVAREVFGQTTMSFLSSGDGGRDGCFKGTWEPNGKEIYEGEFVFQCKFTNRRDYNLKYSDLSEEIPKAEALVKDGLCDIYILITNAGLSGQMSAKVEKKLKSVGVKTVVVLGSGWLNETIRNSTKLRRLVPRVYGLGDLSQILDERVYTQGRNLLESLKDELAKVVITSAYHKADDALDEHGFVLLIGEPAAGKTTIASLLAMGALDQWKASTMKLETAEQVIKHWNPDDPEQFFWIDDAFGVTQYESSLVHRWNHNLTQVKAMLKNGAKIVMTSRDYIYNRARIDLKETAFPIINESQVVIDVHNLSIEEKRQILYNHMKMGNQSIEFKQEIKPFLEYVASLDSFIPETARRLASSFFTSDLFLSERYIEQFVQKQESFLVEVIKGLDKDSLGALAVVYMSNDKLASPLELNATERKAIERLSSTLGGCTDALNALRGNLIQLISTEDGNFWKFKHPTIGDAFAIYVAQSPELIEIYLHGTPTEKLISQVTCGDVGIEKAIVLPKSFFPLIQSKLLSFTKSRQYKGEFLSTWGAKRSLMEFLANRCSKDFLTDFIKQNSKILEDISKPGEYLYYSPDVALVCLLYKYELLPEENRKLFVITVTDYAISGTNVYALNSDEIRELFTEEEEIILLDGIKNELLPELNKLTESYQNEFQENGEAEEYMDSLLETYSILSDHFEEDENYKNIIDAEVSKTKAWISENTFEKTTRPKREKLTDDSADLKSDFSRSIFDDVDL